MTDGQPSRELQPTHMPPAKGIHYRRQPWNSAGDSTGRRWACSSGFPHVPKARVINPGASELGASTCTHCHHQALLLYILLAVLSALTEVMGDISHDNATWPPIVVWCVVRLSP